MRPCAARFTLEAGLAGIHSKRRLRADLTLYASQQIILPQKNSASTSVSTRNTGTDRPMAISSAAALVIRGAAAVCPMMCFAFFIPEINHDLGFQRVNGAMFDSAPDPELPATAIRPQPRALQQSPEFARALMACGQDPLMLEDTLVLQRRLPGGLRLAMVNRADLTDPAPLLAAMRENGFARTPLILSPETPALHLSRLGAVPLATPAHAAIWDLSGDPDQRRAALHQKWRNRLTHGAAQTLRLTRQNLPHDVRHWLFQADAKQQTLRGYRSWPIGLTLAYARENKGQAKLFQAFEGKEAVAAILILTPTAAALPITSPTPPPAANSSAPIPCCCGRPPIGSPPRASAASTSASSIPRTPRALPASNSVPAPICTAWAAPGAFGRRSAASYDRWQGWTAV